MRGEGGLRRDEGRWQREGRTARSRLDGIGLFRRLHCGGAAVGLKSRSGVVTMSCLGASTSGPVEQG